MQTVDMEAPYQILNPEGELIGPLPDGLSDKQLVEWYRMMWLIRFFSNKTVALQRQGRATTWGPLVGQEATAIGMAAPLLSQDWLAGSYRDSGAYMVKGYPMAALFYYTRGFHTPPEVIGPDVRCLPYQIVIGTQMLHSVGLAMAAKIKGEDSVVVAGCGDGATSEGDFNEALNFAGVYKAPVVLVVVNNGWAISMPRHKQSAAKYLAMRGPGFGMPGRLVDGNDIFAMYAVMKDSIDQARSGGGPTLVEAITYRLGAHTTADDPTRYRPKEEADYWEHRDPTKRFRTFLMKRGLLDEASERDIIEAAETEVNEQARIAYEAAIPGPDGFFHNLYASLPPRLERQRQGLLKEYSLQGEGR